MNPEHILAAADVLRQIITPLCERLDAQDARLAALEARPIGAVDKGVYVAGTRYQAGDGATFDGGYWIAQETTSEPPGEGSPAWRLAVHRGKRGREGPPCPCAERRVAS